MICYNGYWKVVLTFAFSITIGMLAEAQDLDPRAYVHVPTHTNALVAGFAYSRGGIVTDPTLPIQDLEATVETFSLSYVNTFNFFGLTSQALVALPYTWAQISGKVAGQAGSVSRAGFSDARMRLSVLLHGGPAVGMPEFLKSPKKTIVGFSVNVGAPTGEFFSDKLINIGTHRWSFKPELALSQPVGKRLLLDVYCGVWLFTTNYSFYPGDSKRTQQPMGAFQAHISYSFTPRFWVALNTTYYTGGTSSINDRFNDDRQNNARIGLTTVLPMGKSNSLKLGVSTGAIVRAGQDFTTVSIGWQHSWIGQTQLPKQ